MKINFKINRSLFSVKLIAILAICLTVAASFACSTMKKDITIEDNDGVTSISTFKNTVEDVLKENGVQLKPQDKISPAMTVKLTDGVAIKISRARNVTIHSDGKETTLLTTALDVKSTLKEAGILLGEKDKLEPAAETLIKGDMTVKIVRVTEQLITKKVKIDFANQISKNEKLDKGIINVVKKGQPGEKELSIKVVYEDGKETSRQIVSEKITKQAQNGIIEEGTKTVLVSSRGQVTRFVKAIKMVATAYDATFESTGKNPGDKYYGITASGIRVRPGIVAVDPKVIPLGTWLYVEGYGEALAADKGSAIKGNRIDLYYESPKDVSRYGKKTVKVYVLDKPRYKF